MNKFEDEKGQMYVELAVILPVAIVIFLIVLNLFWFIEAQIIFTSVALPQLISKSVSPASGSANMNEEVKSALEKSLKDCKRVEVSVSSQSLGENEKGEAQFSLTPHLHRYTATLIYHPFPGDFSVASVQAGIPEIIAHEKTIVIDPYQSGVMF